MITNTENIQTLRDLIATHKTIRYGILHPRVYQTVENHTNRMLALAPVLAQIAKIDYDHNTIDALILAHDLSELGMKRDITSVEQVQQSGAMKRKRELEQSAITSLVNQHGQWLERLFDEYEEQDSQAARFVKWLDKYEASRHMLEITAYSTLHDQVGQDCISFFINTKRLIDATHKVPQLRAFTLNHLENELREIFVRNRQQKKYVELRAMLQTDSIL